MFGRLRGSNGKPKAKVGCGMERYLVYDSACSVCNHLARDIEALAGDKLKAISIHEESASALLDQAFPSGGVRPRCARPGA